MRISYEASAAEKNHVVRMIAFGPTTFYLLMFDDEVMAGHAAAAIRRFAKLMPESAELSPTRKLIQVRASKRTWLDLYEPQVQRARALAERD